MKAGTRLIPGLNMLAAGVDLTELDLQPVTGGEPQGFKNPVIDYTCVEDKQWSNPFMTTSDVNNPNFMQPDQIANVKSASSGKLTSTTQTYSSYSDIKKHMAASVGMSAFGGMFSASSSYQSLSHDIRNKSSQVIEVTNRQSLFSMSFQNQLLLSLGKNPSEILKKCPETYEDDPEAYQSFIEYFGTHLFLSAVFGGAQRTTFKVDSDSIDSHTEEEAQSQVSAVFVSGSVSMSKQQHKTSFESLSNKQTFYFGGNTDLAGGSSSWARSLLASPVILSGKLVPIYKLVRDDEKRKKSLEQAVQYHLDKASVVDLQRILGEVFVLYQSQGGYFGKLPDMIAKVDTLLASKKILNHEIVHNISKEVEYELVRSNLKYISEILAASEAN